LSVDSYEEREPLLSDYIDDANNMTKLDLHAAYMRVKIHLDNRPRV